jgi:hypothetical protein
MTAALASDLRALADRVARLNLSHRDPERFHQDKDEIGRRLRSIARRVERD